MPEHLQVDANGKVVLYPVVGWTTGTLADTAILLALDYAETPADTETGGKSIQLSLTPQQGVELADKLTTLAIRLLGSSQSGPTRH